MDKYAVGAEINIEPIEWLNENNLYLMEIGIASLYIAAPGIVINGSPTANNKYKTLLTSPTATTFICNIEMIMQNIAPQNIEPNLL